MQTVKIKEEKEQEFTLTSDLLENLEDQIYGKNADIVAYIEDLEKAVKTGDKTEMLHGLQYIKRCLADAKAGVDYNIDQLTLHLFSCKER